MKIIKILYRKVSYGDENVAKLSFVLGESMSSVTVAQRQPLMRAEKVFSSTSAVTITEKVSRRTFTSAVTIVFSNFFSATTTQFLKRSKVFSRSTSVTVAQFLKQSEAFRRSSTSSVKVSHRRLIYHVNKIIEVKRLCILESVIKDVLDIAYIAERHMRFARCYERVATS